MMALEIFKGGVNKRKYVKSFGRFLLLSTPNLVVQNNLWKTRRHRWVARGSLARYLSCWIDEYIVLLRYIARQPLIIL